MEDTRDDITESGTGDSGSGSPGLDSDLARLLAAVDDSKAVTPEVARGLGYFSPEDLIKNSSLSVVRLKEKLRTNPDTERILVMRPGPGGHHFWYRLKKDAADL